MQLPTSPRIGFKLLLMFAHTHVSDIGVLSSLPLPAFMLRGLPDYPSLPLILKPTSTPLSPVLFNPLSPVLFNPPFTSKQNPTGGTLGGAWRRYFSFQFPDTGLGRGVYGRPFPSCPWTMQSHLEWSLGKNTATGAITEACSA